jgi:hypothetical protein
MTYDARYGYGASTEQFRCINLHRSAGLRGRIDRYAELAGDKCCIVGMVEVSMPEKYGFWLQAHEIVDDERGSTRQLFGSVNIALQQQYAAFE